MQRALITGIAGQDGSYLAEYLLGLGYEVYGVYRRISSNTDLINLETIINHPHLHVTAGDITDPALMFNQISEFKPEEVYNLAAQSHVGQSFKEPLLTLKVDGEAILIQLEAIRQTSPHTKYYQASTSELYGGLTCPINGYDENSPMHPRSPYAIAKQAAYSSVIHYREAYNLFACNGILFNHSSVRRGIDFATRKITHGVASIKLGYQEHLSMGNLAAYRDEGHSKDYTKAMHLILQQERPEDFVVATGDGATIGEMLAYVCELAELDVKDVYRQDERYMRPSDVPYLRGNPAKIKALGWEPTYTWKSLLKEMYEHDLHKLLSL